MSNKKTFAFKLAAQKKSKSAGKKWTIRDGVSVSGCTDLSGCGMYAASYHGYDDGEFC
ncbi:hypothetical protein N9W89_11070 [Hellea sp.]|nr:hypothetical protein [Hellea sp.]